MRITSTIRLLCSSSALLILLVVPQTVFGATTHTVNIRDNSFQPASLQIQAGDTVIWTHIGTAQHTVTSDGGSFTSSPNLSPGDAHTVTFPAAGNFSYHCAFHSNMTGSISVQPVPTPTPTPTISPSLPTTLPPLTPSPQPATGAGDCDARDILCSPVNLLITESDPNRDSYIGRIRREGPQVIILSIAAGFASIASTFTFVGLIYGGFLYITARGEEEQITKAKQFIIYTLIGLVLLSLSYVIVVGLRDLLYGP